MFELIYLFIFSAGYISADTITYDTKDARQYFEEFITTYDKSYESNEEIEKRLEIFRQNLIEINDHNKENYQALYGINKFSDLTLQEFLDQYTSNIERQMPKNIVYKTIVEDKGVKRPANFDWRHRNIVTPVKDQGKCEAGWIFSVVGNLEGQLALVTGKLLELSTQQVIDCANIQKSCEGRGNEFKAMEYFLDNGAMLEKDYPYEGVKKNCKYDINKVALNLTTYIGMVMPEKSFELCLFNFAPLPISVDATSLKQYKGGILQGKDCAKRKINHGVLMVGYGEENGVQFWTFKNSWGEKWGENGFFRVQRGINCIGLHTMPPISSLL